MELQKVREQSEPIPNIRLSKQIHALKQLAGHAAWVREWISKDQNNWHQLSLKDQKLWQEHDDKDNLRQIAELRAQQEPRFSGSRVSDRARHDDAKHVAVFAITFGVGALGPFRPVIEDRC